MSSAVRCRTLSNITVEKPDALNQLIVRPTSVPICRSNRLDTNKSNISSDNNSDVDGQNWLCPELIKKVQMESDPVCRQTSVMCKHLLDAEHQYSRDISDILRDRDVLDLRRRELLHRKWTKRVYEPIRCAIDEQTGAADVDRLIGCKQQLYSEFLEHCNRRGQIFLDTSGEMSAAYLNRKLIRLTAKTDQLNDPLLSQSRTRTAEDQDIVRCITGRRLSSADIEQLRLPPVRLSPASRDDLSWLDWRNMYISQIESPAHIAERKKMNPNKTKSHLSWANYYTPVDPQVVADEIRVRKGEPYRPPRRAATAATASSRSHNFNDDLPQPVSAM